MGVFHTDLKLMDYSENGTALPSEHCHDEEKLEMIGRVLVKALIEGTYVSHCLFNVWECV